MIRQFKVVKDVVLTTWVLSISQLLQANTCGLALDISNLNVDHQARESELHQQFEVSKPKQATGSECSHYFIVYSSAGRRAESFLLDHETHASSHFQYRLYRKPNRSGELTAVSAAMDGEHVLSASFQGSAISNLHDHYYVFDFARYEGEKARSGNYHGRQMLKLYSGTVDGEHVLEDSEVIFISTRVEKSISLTLLADGQSVEAGSKAKVMDFDELESGESQSIDMLVDSNTPYRLSLSSHNKGRLKHDKLKEYIPYLLTVDGLRQGVKASNNSVQGYNIGRTLHKTTVTIGNTNDKIAGRYYDFVTITATAN